MCSYVEKSMSKKRILKVKLFEWAKSFNFYQPSDVPLLLRIINLLLTSPILLKILTFGKFLLPVSTTNTLSVVLSSSTISLCEFSLILSKGCSKWFILHDLTFIWRGRLLLLRRENFQSSRPSFSRPPIGCFPTWFRMVWFRSFDLIGCCDCQHSYLTQVLKVADLVGLEDLTIWRHQLAN